MGVLEQVSQMKGQGIPEQEIVSRLKQQRISPKEINDALNQSRIKDAVYNPEETDMTSQEQIPMPQKGTYEPTYAPQTQDITSEENIPQQQETYAPQQEEYAPPPQEEYSPPQEMYQQETYAPQQEEYGSDMMIEISEQVFNEKIKKIEKQINQIKETQVLLQTQTEYAVTRVKRIELVMDNLQVAILEKIGSYGKNLEVIKKEMGMIEDSFTKIVPGAKRPTHKKVQKKTSKKK